MNCEMGHKEDYAISTWLYEKRPLEGALRSIRHAGFQAVELWANGVHADPRVTPRPADVRQTLRDSGLQVHSIHAPFTGFGRTFPDAAFFARWFDAIVKTMEVCSETGASLMVFHVLSRDEYNYTPKELPRIRDLLEEVVDEAKKKGITVLLENLNSGRLQGEFDCTIEKLAEAFGALDIGYCIDISHSVLTRQKVADEISLAGRRLLSVHVSNTCGSKDLHALPNDGVIEWSLLRQTFLNSGYTGKFVLEINGRDNPDMVLQQICDLFNSPRSCYN
jgi:sugar phosphate isomerase/epimerase